MAVQTTKCSGQSSNPLSEMGTRVGDNSVPSLQKQTRLDQKSLAVLYNNGSGKNINQYAGYLYILVNGWKALDKSFSYHESFAPFVVSKQTYNDFINKDSGILFNCGILDVCKKVTPAGKVGQLNDLGRLGLFSRLTGFQITNPMTGPATHLPPGAKDTLQEQHGGFVEGLQSVCESINTHAYLKCFAVGSYGGIQQAVHSLTNVVQDFYSAMYDLYQDMQLLMIQAQMIMQQYIMDLEYFLTNEYLSNKVKLFLALVCLVLSTIQTLIDDIAFFGSLFNGSDNLFSVLNSIQSVVNIGAQAMVYIYNPISAGLPALFPREAKQVLDFINNLDNLPEQYMGILLKNFSFGKAMNNKGIAIANSIIQRFGLGSQLGDLNPILQSFGCAVPAGNWHRTAAPVLKGPISFKTPRIPYNLRGRVKVDPYSLSSIWQMVKSDFSNLRTDGGVLAKDVENFGNQLKNVFVPDNNITG
jgi:hypothetical protein